MGWQPIESAPRDWTVFLGWGPSGMAVVFYDGEKVCLGQASSYCSPEDTDYEPTHWMPLPLPPGVHFLEGTDVIAREPWTHVRGCQYCGAPGCDGVKCGRVAVGRVSLAPFCCKCGGVGIRVRWHGAKHRNLYPPHACPDVGEHLHYYCGCGYEWVGETRDCHHNMTASAAHEGDFLGGE